MQTTLKLFRLISILEALSFLILLGIAMPLKYFWDMPKMVQIVGMLHGILFLLYIGFAIYVQQYLKWSSKTLVIILLCSIIPFGPFYVEKKYL